MIIMLPQGRPKGGRAGGAGFALLAVDLGMGLAPAFDPLSTIGHRREPQADAFQAVRLYVLARICKPVRDAPFRKPRHHHAAPGRKTIPCG